jgi:formate hydrogenlyase transcriptional activator
LRAVAANIREVIHADAAAVSMPDATSGKFRVFAMDFPHGKGIVKEELLVTTSAAHRTVMDTLKPVVFDTRGSDELSPEGYGMAVAEGIKAICLIPLVNHGRALGTLSISRTTETPFIAEDVDFLSRASGSIAIAIENAMAQAEVERQNEQLHRSQRELREVIESIPSMAWSAAADGAAEFFNRRWLDYAGLSPDQLRGWGWTVAVHPDDLNEIADYWRGVLASGEPGEIEGRLRRFDGVYRWFLFRAIPSFDDKGAVVKWYGTNTDIEERKRSEQALAVQNTRLDLLLQLTKRITSNLELREVLRTVSANVREVMHADAAGVAFFDEVSVKSRIYAVDFPDSKGFVKEDIVVTPGFAFKRAWKSSEPVIVSTSDREELGPEIYQLVVKEGLNGHCLIPLVSRGRTVGLLIVARKLEGSFTREEVGFVCEASGQIAIALENALAYREISELKDKLAQEKFYLEEEFRSEMGFEQIIGNSTALKHVLQLVETVAPSDSTVLLLGETGTGKELIARAIHDRSRRNQRTFVKLNCAAIPTGLVESELFGHEKGAFTGAIAPKIGRLELADQGTLFLDEVGDIPIEIQPKLLRALQEREFERLGSTHTRKVNVRVVAATNRDLENMVANKEFRSDLYYRLNVFPIRIPPLRDRKEDIPPLVSYFVQKFAKEMQKRIEAVPAAVMKGLTGWDWPGNIRELENFIERAVLLTRGKSLEAPLAELRKTNTEGSRHADLDDATQVATHKTDIRSDQPSVAEEYARKQRDEIVRALTACKGRVGGADGAAARLGMNRTTLLARMKKFGIYAKQYA